MLPVKINKKLKHLPENWDEVPTGKLSELLSLYYQDLPQDEFRIAAVFVLLSIPTYQKTLFPSDSLTILCEKLDWLLTSHPNITENPHTTLGKLQGTDNVLNDFRMWEYVLTEQAYKDWVDTPTDEKLNYFLAHWYRPKRSKAKLRRLQTRSDWDGDTRRPFIEHEIKKHVRHLHDVPFTQKLTVAHFFSNELVRIMHDHPHLFEGGKSEKAGGDYTWADTILAISPINKEDETAQNKLSTILRRLENDRRNYERTKSADVH